MTHRFDPLQQTERLQRPLWWSVGLHVALFTTTVAWGMFDTTVSLGDPNASPGSAVPISITEGVPLTRSRAKVERPVANPVEHEVPSIPEPPRPTPQPEAVEEPDAVPVEKQRRRRRPPSNAQKNQKPPPKNQVASSTGAAVSSPLYTGRRKSGGGGVGFGSSSPFGARFGWYAEGLQRRIATEWRKALGQAADAGSRRVAISFVILRNGAIRNTRVVQSSGNRSLDYSAHRAVVNSNPVQPLPPQLRKSSIQVEMWFQLQ